MLLALDPGMNSPGVALFRPDPGGGPWPELIAAGRVTIPRHFTQNDAGQRWFYVAKSVEAWYATQAKPCEHLLLVFEKPQWYARTKSKGDPNDLVGVAGVAANVCGLMRPAKIMSPEPAMWIGQVPKTCYTCKANKRKCPVCKGSAWNTPRGQRIRSRLSVSELALVPDQNDAIDAVGLGLWACGRLTPKSALSNGRDGR